MDWQYRSAYLEARCSAYVRLTQTFLQFPHKYYFHIMTFSPYKQLLFPDTRVIGLSVQSRGAVLINWRRTVRAVVGRSDLQRHWIELCTLVLDYGWPFWWLGRELFGLTWNGNCSLCLLWAGRRSTVRSNYGLPVSLMCPIGRLRRFTC